MMIRKISLLRIVKSTKRDLGNEMESDSRKSVLDEDSQTSGQDCLVDSEAFLAIKQVLLRNSMHFYVINIHINYQILYKRDNKPSK